MYKAYFAENNDARYLRLANAIAEHLIHRDLIETVLTISNKKPRRAKEIGIRAISRSKPLYGAL